MRGGNAVGHFNTTNLLKHLDKHHTEQHQGFLQAKATKKSKMPQQQTLLESIKKQEKLCRDSNKAKSVLEKLVPFIVLDNQSLSVVENVWFRRLTERIKPHYTLLSCHYIMEKAIPHMHNAQFPLQTLAECRHCCLTTDILSSNVSTMSLLNLNTDWIDLDFTLKKAVLHAKEFHGSHIGDSVTSAIEEMLHEWKINKNKVHVGIMQRI